MRVTFVDTEYTAWEGSVQRAWSLPWEHKEIIQIGAVSVDIRSDYEELERFMCYVKPFKNPQLSEYVTKLTGITQDAIEIEGVSFAHAMEKLSEYIVKMQSESVLCWNDDDEIIRLNCDYNQLPHPEYTIYDIRPFFDRLGISTQDYYSSTIHQYFGLEDFEKKHDALGDACNLAYTVREISRSDSMIGRMFLEFCSAYVNDRITTKVT